MKALTDETGLNAEPINPYNGNFQPREWREFRSISPRRPLTIHQQPNSVIEVKEVWFDTIDNKISAEYSEAFPGAMDRYNVYYKPIEQPKTNKIIIKSQKGFEGGDCGYAFDEKLFKKPSITPELTEAAEKQPFEHYPELADKLLHAARFWKTDDTWSATLNEINKVCAALIQSTQDNKRIVEVIEKMKYAECDCYEWHHGWNAALTDLLTQIKAKQ